MARADDTAATTEGGATPPGGKPATELRELIDKMRGRVDATGKLLGALGTTAATTFGIAKLDAVLPVPDGKWWVAVLAALALLMAIAGVLYVAVRLSSVSRPLLMRTDLAAMQTANEISERERALVQPLYDDVAQLNRVRSLSAYEWQLGSLRRVASWVPSRAERRRRTELADGIAEDIQLTLGRGAVILIRHRATKAVTGGRARIAYAAVVIGFVGFTLAADGISSSQPAEQAKVARACADARRAGATRAELQAISGCSTAADSAPPDRAVDSAAEARACAEARAAGATEEELGAASCTAVTARR